MDSLGIRKCELPVSSFEPPWVRHHYNWGGGDIVLHALFHQSGVAMTLLKRYLSLHYKKIHRFYGKIPCI